IPGKNEYARLLDARISGVPLKESKPKPHHHDMKKLIALTVAAAFSQAVAAFAGPPPMSSKEVVPAPAPPPLSFFRPNEFDIGAFATYVTGTGDNPTGTRIGRFGGVTTLTGETTVDGWGGGMDFSYFFPWKYAGVRFQGAAAS